MSSVPRHFALKSISNKKLFLCYVHEKNELNGFLQFSSEEVVSPYTKFEIEKSSIGKGYVHIRCCYNNKYWVLQSQSNSHYIVATAKEREEDQSKYSCTLFKPIYDGDNNNKGNIFCFRHVHLNLNIHLKEADGSKYQGCLEVKASKDGKNPDRLAEFSTFINWDTLFILPKYAAFQENGYFLRPTHHVETKKVFLEFKSTDKADPGVRNEVTTTPDGHVRIKNVPYGKFWILDPEENWIVLDDNSSTAKDDPRTLFWPIKLDHNVVALRNVSNNRFCKRLSESYGYDNSLNAALNYISDEAKLQVTELVLSRNIYNVLFHLEDARTYNEKPLLMTSTIVENNNSEPQTSSIKLSYEDTTTSTWGATVNGTFGVKMTIETGVPKASKGKVEVEAEISETYAWGETQQMKCLAEVVHEVTVPAWTKVKASIMATQASCDVPFSYTQRDKLMNGKYVTQRHHDGVYNVVNSYNFHFVAEEIA